MVTHYRVGNKNQEFNNEKPLNNRNRNYFDFDKQLSGAYLSTIFYQLDSRSYWAFYRDGTVFHEL